jgi:catechol 2,3-dioxygenase-like lactoylglutathione lyase family enzyme
MRSSGAGDDRHNAPGHARTDPLPAADPNAPRVALTPKPVADIASLNQEFRCVCGCWGRLVAVGIRRLDHVQLAMPAGREAEAVAFYEGVLGISHVPKPYLLAVRGGCWFEDGDLKVHLGVDVSFRPATKAHPAFIVDDVRAIAAAVVAGLAVDDDEPLDGFDRVYVSDPFGNRIELMQPSA